MWFSALLVREMLTCAKLQRPNSLNMSCPECGCEDICDEDPECNMCNECGHCWEAEEEGANTTAEASRYAGYAVGQVLDAEAVPKKVTLAHSLTHSLAVWHPRETDLDCHSLALLSASHSPQYLRHSRVCLCAVKYASACLCPVRDAPVCPPRTPVRYTSLKSAVSLPLSHCPCLGHVGPVRYTFTRHCLP